jgi:hypothetical protein
MKYSFDDILVALVILSTIGFITVILGTGIATFLD